MNARTILSAGIVIVVLAALAVGAYMIYKTYEKPEALTSLCVEVLPQDQRVGIKIEATAEGGVKLDLSGMRGTNTGASPAQIEGFIRCLESAKRTVTVEAGVRLPLEPVGQVANRWQREAGAVRLRLMPGSNDEALNNLRIGPATGLKENVIGQWCSPEQAGACVACEPPDPNAQTVEVLVRLRENAPVKRERMDGTWPPRSSGIPAEPWQLVNAAGERFYYECQKP